MPTCTLCGRSVLFFRRTHSRCRKVNLAAREKVAALAERWLAGQVRSDEVRVEVERLEREAFLVRTHRGEALRAGFERMVRQALDDAVLTTEEESELAEFIELFEVGRKELDRDGWFTRYLQSATLRDLLRGKLPSSTLAVELEPGEVLLWHFPTAQLTGGELHEKSTEVDAISSVSGPAGVYFRLADLRQLGGQRRILKPVDVGALGVTNRHLHFAGRRNRLRFRLEDLERLEPTAGGVSFRRAGGAELEGFETGDSWFLINLLTNAKNASGS